MDTLSDKIIRLRKAGFKDTQIAEALNIETGDIDNIVNKQTVYVRPETVTVLQEKVGAINPYSELKPTGDPLNDALRGASLALVRELNTKIHSGMSEKDMRLVIYGLTSIARVNGGTTNVVQNNFYANGEGGNTSLVDTLRD